MVFIFKGECTSDPNQNFITDAVYRVHMQVCKVALHLQGKGTSGHEFNLDTCWKGSGCSKDTFGSDLSC